MKTVGVLAILVVCMLACAMAQVAPYGYNYGYTSYTPGARVSQYASSGYAAPAAYYGAYHHAGYPYRYY